MGVQRVDDAGSRTLPTPLGRVSHRAAGADGVSSHGAGAEPGAKRKRLSWYVRPRRMATDHARSPRLSAGAKASSAQGRYAQPAPERANRTDAEGVTAPLLDDGDRAWGEPSPAPGRAEPPSPGVRSVDVPFEEALPFQAAHHLRGHLDVGAGEHRQGDLRGVATLRGALVQVEVDQCHSRAARHPWSSRSRTAFVD